ncbi:hypothetical protein K438DRAFT_1942897 [Mycena galopus ATCC 62051]|nr:hypothetical protein K438DRAFT_1942897 [Mycena galopus ATCC 62051]
MQANTDNIPAQSNVPFASFCKEPMAESACPPPNRAYPVLSLPPEIVAEIFTNFLPSYPERPPHVGIFSPLLLCQICGPWRQIALTTPWLWRAVSIELHDRENRETVAWKLALLETWLSRSGACLLSIRLHYQIDQFRPPFGNTAHPSLSEFLHTVVRRCERWEHIDCVMPFAHLHIIQGDMPQLRNLVFGPSDLPDNEDEPVTLLELFGRAPQLTDVVLTECFVPSSMHLPWSQLTYLEALCLYEHECMEIFSYATNLIRCTMAVCGPSEPSAPPPVIPVHSHLRDLTFITLEADVILADILDLLTLPALRTLEVPEQCVSVADPISTLTDLVARSRCTLDELRIKKALLAEDLYRSALPSVRMLTLEPCPGY